MAGISEGEMPFHAGEVEMHDRLRVPDSYNPTTPHLSPHAGYILQRAPLIALGTLDDQGRPWSSVWGGELEFEWSFAQSIIGLQTTVGKYDPVLNAILKGYLNGEVASENATSGKMVSALAIDLENRKRIKLFGRLIAASFTNPEEQAGPVKLFVQIDQSLGKSSHVFERQRAVN